jgi:hypothetical protein
MAAAPKRRCRKTSNCEEGETCDANHFCREMRQLGRKPLSQDFYKSLCEKKFIPLVYERGQIKGDQKAADALRRCNYQPARPHPMWSTIVATGRKKPASKADGFDDMPYADLLLTYHRLLSESADFNKFMKRRKKSSIPSEVSLRSWLMTFKTRPQ